MATENLVAAVADGDLDELTRLVDRLCSARDWETLAALRERCRRAHEQSGRQLWPAASHAEYRLALEAPGPWAAAVLVEGSGRFAPGPLPEVAASTHEWNELAPDLSPGAPAVLAAHERVLRGEDLTGAALPGPPVLDLPLQLQPWEPGYCLAEYRAHDADFPGPRPARLESVRLPAAGERLHVPAGTDALLEVVRAWVAGSAGRVDAVVVEGTVLHAIAATGASAARVGALDAGDALAWLAWAGATGGAYGRRPGAAAGRFAAWWVVAAVGGDLEDELATRPDAIGDAAARLRWYAWDRGDAATGWVVRLAIEDPATGRAWALDAHDPGGDKRAET